MSIAPWLLLAGIAGAPAGPDPATADPADGAALLDEVTVVASRLEQPLAEVPATVSTIDRETLDRTLVVGIADVVRYLPGIGVGDDATRFGAQGYSIRGLDGNRVAIELDDIPIADGFAVGSFSRAGRDVVDPALLQGIEILRGPASTLYGSDALAGVVAYRTRDPLDLLARAEGEAWLGGRAGVDSRDDSVALGASGAWAQGPWSAMAWLGGRDGHETDNQPRPGGLEANPADTRDRYGLVKLGREWDAGGRWMLAAERSEFEQQTDVQSLVAGPGQYATTTRLTGDDSAERERVSLHGAVPLDAPGLERLRALAYTQSTRTVQATDQFRRGATPSQPATRRERRFDYDTRSNGLELSLDGRYAFGSTAHRYVAGIDLARTDIEQSRDGQETNLATGISTPVILGERFPVRDFPPSVVDEIGLYAQDEIVFDEGPVGADPRAALGPHAGRRAARRDLDRRQSRHQRGRPRRSTSSRRASACAATSARPAARGSPTPRAFARRPSPTSTWASTSRPSTTSRCPIPTCSPSAAAASRPGCAGPAPRTRCRWRCGPTASRT